MPKRYAKGEQTHKGWVVLRGGSHSRSAVLHNQCRQGIIFLQLRVLNLFAVGSLLSKHENSLALPTYYPSRSHPKDLAKGILPFMTVKYFSSANMAFRYTSAKLQWWLQKGKSSWRRFRLVSYLTCVLYVCTQPAFHISSPFLKHLSVTVINLVGGSKLGTQNIAVPVGEDACVLQDWWAALAGWPERRLALRP
jgi:hypothetical protein